MRQAFIASWYALLLVSLPWLAQSQPGQKGDVETVRERLVANAMGGRPNADAARALMEALREDGSWPDVDYEGTRRSSWQPAEHMSRLAALTRAFAHGQSALAGDANLLAATLRAYDYWTEKDFQCPNWWWNQIGIPQTLSNVMLLLGDRLTEERVSKGLVILRRAKLGMTGQNLVWVAEITVARGCIEGDAKVIAEAFGRIAGEIRVSDGEGIQADASFYQHGTQLYSGGYGRGFAIDCARFARLAHGTAFAFPEGRIDILSMYLLDGEQWMIRGKQFDLSACGREITRPGGGSSSGFADACSHMIAMNVPRREEFETFRARLQSDPLAPDPPLVGNRHFWRSDLMVHHRPGYYASVRMTSKRLLQTELVNGENPLGRHLSDGLNYLYHGAGPYAGIFPVWDWEKLPGTTCEQTGDVSVRNGTRGERSFVGGVSDGLYGMAAMDFARGGLTCKKAWFFFDDEYVCLGAGIRCESEHPVVTTVQQCLLDGDVLAGSAGGQALAPSVHELNAERWVHHAGVGYVFLEATDVELANGAQKGSWGRIGPVQTPQIEADVFRLSINHGASPKGAGYSYVVAPGMSAEKIAEYAQSLRVKVLANTSALQACRCAVLGVLGIAAYEAGTVALEGLPEIKVSQPCLLLWREDAEGVTVAVSNPENEPGTIEVEVGEILIGGGARAAEGSTVLTFELPGGLEAGRSVVKRLMRP